LLSPDGLFLMHPKSFVGRAQPEPAGGAYSAPPDPLAEFKGAYF